MSIYLDTSFVFALMVEDSHSNRANAFLQDRQDELIVSDFAAAEFSAAVARHVRTGKATPQAAKAMFADFDTRVYLFAQRAETETWAVKAAEAFIRRLDLNLKAPYALHLAIARRVGATLATFDQQMIANAGVLGIPVVAA